MSPRPWRVSPRLGLTAIAIAGVLLPISANSWASSPVPGGELPTSGAELYRAACSSCHGADGRGAPPSLVGFDVPLPDFTDCSFASREPAADWMVVAHEGGPIRGFSELMPAFGGVLSMEQIGEAVLYIKSLCRDSSWPDGAFNLPRALVTGKAYPEDELVLSSAIAAEGDGEIANKLIFEKRFGARNQWEAVVPFGWWESRASDANGSSSWNSGVGDIALALKRAFYHRLERGTILSAAAELILPTGDDDRGFGKGTTVFEPFLAWGQILPANFFLQSQAGFELPFDSDRADNEAFLRMLIGNSLSSGQFGRTWSPMVELLAARELVSGADTNWDVVPQVQITLNTRQHIMLNIGVRAPITNTAGRNTTVMVYLLWDWFDGGFTQGW
jgi:mono/diheme cytochrome c family protein